MLGDINLDLKPKEYDIQICKPNRMTIGNVREAFNITYKGKLESIDEIEFDVPYYITNANKIRVKNPNWDKLLGDYLLFVNEEKYFVIDFPSESGGDGLDIKHIHAYSLEYSLRQKLLRGFQVTRELYDITENKVGVLNQFELDTSWKVGHIDDTLVFDENEQKIYRTFDISEKSWLSFIREDLKKAFNCIAIFDTINKTINLYDIDSFGQNKGLNISEANYLKTIKKEIKHDDIVTQLKVYGYNNISVQEVNPLGTDYLEDYSYYKTNHMDNNLVNALNTYEALAESNKGTFAGYLTSLDTLNTTLTTKQTELTNLKSELKIIQDNIDIAITQGTSLTALNSQKTTKANQINAKQLEIDGVNNSILSVKSDITTLKNLLDKKNNFALEQLELLDFFTKTQTWQNETISFPNELYIAGKKELAKRNTPPIQFSIDIIDFLKIIKFQHDWHKLILGDLINIEYTTFDTNIEVRLMGYTHNYDSNSLTIEFSNKDDMKTDDSVLRDILTNSANASTTMNMNKPYWDYGLDNKNKIEAMRISDLNTARNRIVTGDKQNIYIDEHGIHLGDFENPLAQLRLLNNCIAMSTDGWETADLAITPQGIVAKKLVGEIIAGNKLMITNEVGDFTIDQNGIKATNMDLTLTRGTSTIKINPTDGIKIQKNGVNIFYVDGDGNLSHDGRQMITENGVLLIENYRNSNGGLTQIYDINGSLNVKLGSENGTGANRGGTLILYDDNLNSPKVELGISSLYGAGTMNLKDSNGIVRVMGYANSSNGSALAVLNSSQVAVSYLTESVGKIGGLNILTEGNWSNYVSLSNYATNSYVDSQISGLWTLCLNTFAQK